MARAIGFSTGSLAGGNFQAALSALRCTRATAVELSALREDELEPLMRELGSLDLNQFSHVSVHAPSSLERYTEKAVIQLLKPAIERSYSIVVHADVIEHLEIWRPLGPLALIENMDKRKSTGRTVAEMRRIQSELPDARFCVDLGHSRQIDPTLSESMAMLATLGERIGQLHLSELNSQSKHVPLTYTGVAAFEYIKNLLPQDVPIILEYPCEPPMLDAHIVFIEGLLYRQSSVEHPFEFQFWKSA